MAFAHSPNTSDQWHDLADHLKGTSERARTFAAVFGGADAAAALGYWHDLGKLNQAWQDYLAASTANPRLRGTGPEHKLAGALLAMEHERLRPFALAIAGHHGGLPSRSDFTNVSLADEHAVVRAKQSLHIARTALPELDVPVAQSIPQSVLSGGVRAGEHFIRMVFSALVDADFLDTEQHFDAARTDARDASPPEMEALLDRLLDDQRARFGNADGPMAVARREIFEACRRAAELPPGPFRLTVPTGGGKTRAALAFALEHAARHGQRRVIVAVPFLSITDQTAGVYREIFPEPGTVLEHHSAFDEGVDIEGARPEVTWSRLAAENWDAPIIVTTTVQLLESLFANKPSRTRKLHNIAGSVLILDEVQSLPVPLLTPTLEMLDGLVRYYGVTVVLSSATQPAYEVLPAFTSLQLTEIVPDPGRFYAALKRVTYEARTDRGYTWDEVAAWLAEEHRALAIVNTKADALALLDTLAAAGVPDVLHLSTLLCGAHRRDVLAEVRRRQQAGERCIIVSTQVVEAGVDLDFPAVYRAMGPLDAIIQAAGRCNREFKLPDRGRVVIFDPADGHMPGGAYRTATDQARAAMLPGAVDLDSLYVIEDYYRRFLTLPDTDGRNIQKLRDDFDYPEVAARYRLIDDDTEAVIITDYGSPEEQVRVAALIKEARAAEGNPRWMMRALQPFIVAVRRRQMRDVRAGELVEEVKPGLNVWLGRYDAVRGLIYERADVLVV